MITPADEFPIHQAPLPIAWPASSDRNFYDRSYLCAHDRTGDVFVIMGVGYYPVLGVKDAFVLVRRGEVQTAVRLSDAMDGDRLHPVWTTLSLHRKEGPCPKALHLPLDSGRR